MTNEKINDTGFAKIDLDRQMRTGIPEAVYCNGKTPSQVAKIFSLMVAKNHRAIATRATLEQLQAIKKSVPKVTLYPSTHLAVYSKTAPPAQPHLVVVATGGTSDIPVAEEAALTLEFLGIRVDRIYDVGIAALDRILSKKSRLKKAHAVIAVAGMDGALPTIIAGLVTCLVVGVPTSIGYGTGKDGHAALLTMLNTCSPGLAVVNIDNGFGGACVVAKSLTSQ